MSMTRNTEKNIMKRLSGALIKLSPTPVEEVQQQRLVMLMEVLQAVFIKISS